MLVDGKWSSDWHPLQGTDAKGGFVRQVSAFRNWITPDGRPGPTGEGGFAAEAGRYHLYVALTCPWASRALIGRKLKKLDEVISVTVAEPTLTPQGWRFGDFPGADRDTLNGATYVHEIYTRADPHFTGRATVPALWDKKRRTIVNNELADILRMLNSGFGPLADASLDLYPADLAGEIDALNERLYQRLNNGVYRAGFAITQAAYEEAFHEVFGDARRTGGAARRSPLPLRRPADGNRHPRLRFAGALRRRLCRPVQVQQAPDRRLSRAPGLSDAGPGPAGGARDRVHRRTSSAAIIRSAALNPNGVTPLGPDIAGLTDGG